LTTPFHSQCSSPFFAHVNSLFSTQVFTLIDTYHMEVTMFEAVRPPIAVFLCGEEGGMQRAVACSYDWTTQTFFRETVLRMPTTSEERMTRVPRFRFGMSRPQVPVTPLRKATV
jgi:hypothetical protein